MISGCVNCNDTNVHVRYKSTNGYDLWGLKQKETVFRKCGSEFMDPCDNIWISRKIIPSVKFS